MVKLPPERKEKKVHLSGKLMQELAPDKYSEGSPLWIFIREGGELCIYALILFVVIRALQPVWGPVVGVLSAPFKQSQTETEPKTQIPKTQFAPSSKQSAPQAP